MRETAPCSETNLKNVTAGARLTGLLLLTAVFGLSGCSDDSSPTGANQQAPPPSSAEMVVFTEVMPNPSAIDDASGEWFELSNTSAQALDLQSCKLVSGTDTLTIAASVRIEPGGFVTFARSTSPGFTPNGTFDFSLSNTIDNLVLVCGGVVIDTYDWATSTNGASWSRSPGSDTWCAGSTPYGPGDFGTPGSGNPICP